MDTPKRVVSKKIGQLLKERGLLTEAQLVEALALQQKRGGLLGQILIRLGYATEEAIAQALTTQYGFPYLPLQSYVIDAEIVRLIPENVARQYCLIPVDRIGDTLTIAMADPLETPKAVEDIELLTHCTVQVFVATVGAVADAIQRHYGQNHALP